MDILFLSVEVEVCSTLFVFLTSEDTSSRHLDRETCALPGSHLILPLGRFAPCARLGPRLRPSVSVDHLHLESPTPQLPHEYGVLVAEVTDDGRPGNVHPIRLPRGSACEQGQFAEEADRPGAASWYLRPTPISIL